MERLVEQTTRAASSEEWLADLVRATPPLKAAPFEAPRVHARVVGASRRAGPLLAPTLTVVLLLGAGAVAMAAGRQLWLARESRSLIAAQASLPVHRVGSAAAPLAPSAGSPTVLPAGAPSTSDGRPLDPPVPTSAARAPAAVAPPSGRAVAPKSTAAGEDPGLVLAAIHALRVEGDSARASALLTRYLKLHPRGVLAEDAVALSIEAAADRHDGRAVAEWGRAYLAQFPNGRFRAIAQRASQSGAR